MKAENRMANLITIQNNTDASIVSSVETLFLEKQRLQIEYEFQTYFTIILIRTINNDYLIPEWNLYYEWGEKSFTLEDIYRILINYQNLEKLFPDLRLKPCQEVLDLSQLH